MERRVAPSIRYAIESGFKLCDFGRGDEDYKFSLGAEPRFNTNLRIERLSSRLVFNRLRNRLDRMLK